MIKVSANSDVMLIHGDENEVHLCGLPPKDVQLKSNHEKNLRQSPTRGHSAIDLTRTIQNCKGHQKHHKKQSQPKG